MKYMLLICGDETAAAEHAYDGCEGWGEEMERRGLRLALIGCP